MTSLFRYPGGKFKLAPKIVPQIEMMNRSVYIEPFCGGASVAIELSKRNPGVHIVLNDLNEKIADFWKTVIRDYRDLSSLVASYVPTVDDFYDRKNKSDALSILVVNRCSHSGRGGGPIGGNNQCGKWLIDARWNGKRLSDEILTIGKMLTGRCEVHSCDGISLINEFADNCSIYADPPYVKAGKELYEKWFSSEDHIRLSKALFDKSNWVLSYDMDITIASLYSNMPKVKLTEIQMLSAHHSGGSKLQSELMYVKRIP